MDLPIIDDPVGAKLAWAYQHLKELDLQIVTYANAFRKGDAYEITREIDRETGEEVHRLRLAQLLPTTQWGLLLSEVVHLTRSCLDNLIERLTIQNTGAAIEGTSFPVYVHANEYHRVGSRAKSRGLPTRDSGLYKVQGLTPVQQAYVESLQPYRSGDDESAWRTNALWVINELWNMDKHRTPPISVSGAFTTRLEFVSGLTRDAQVMLKFPIENGAELVRLVAVPGQTQPEMQVKAEIGIEVTFDDGSPGFGRRLVETLDQAHIGVSRIVRTLDPKTTMEIVATEIN